MNDHEMTNPPTSASTTEATAKPAIQRRDRCWASALLVRSAAIRLSGLEHASLTVAGAMAAGIAFVHQELNLFDNLDVAANVMIGREPVWGGPLRLIARLAG